MKNPLKKMYRNDGQDRLLPRLSLFVFDRSRIAASVWLLLTVFGILSYTTFLKKEGFPSINIPYAIASGAYLVNDPAKVDQEVAKPISDIVIKDSHVKSVQTQAQGNTYAVILQYTEDTNTAKVSKALSQKVKDARVLPAGASMSFETPKFGFTPRGDDNVISVYAKQKGATTAELKAEGDKVAAFIKSKHFPEINTVSTVDPFVSSNDPITKQVVSTQTSFDRYAQRNGNTNSFYDAVSVGIDQRDGTDVIKFEAKLQDAITQYNRQNTNAAYSSVVSASYANDIKDQIGELQKALLEGLIAVLIIGSIVIAVRASFITIIAMITVLAITLGVLFVTGYSLNTITLFSIILCMGLVVDDTIIMVEAIDAQRRRSKDARDIVKVATRKVSRAMVAATCTAALSFAPLLFVGGILGGFIRSIPVTVITSLITSLLVALIFIPLFARYILLGKKQLGAKNMHEPAAGIEAKVAAFIGRPMLWARHHKKRLFGVGIGAVLIGFSFIGVGVALFQKVTFNIFPPSKDTNGLMVTMNFMPGTTVTQAEAVADKADKLVADKLGDNFKTASYFSNASNRSATLTVNIIPYSKRDVRSPELVTQLQSVFDNGFPGAKVKVGQLDIGPPPSAFSVRIETDDRTAGLKLAEDINKFLANKELQRPSGEIAKITEVTVSDAETFTRADGKLYMDVTANFDGTDTSTLVTLAQSAVDKEFNARKLATYGLPKDTLNYDFGQEDENQDSFKSLVMAFPILLLAIYLLLSIQFRSLLQPLLIFMAIPFSLLGITLGLYLTDNAFSFFAMLGFFALIGLSIKNTILLTDYANQLRREGLPAVDAAVGALGERFRPLIATSFTAVVSLLPLAITSPFWEGLAVVLICGLLSSTFLVIMVFPYYYLGAEYLRLRVSRAACLIWLALTIVLVIVLSKVTPAAAVAAPLVSWALTYMFRKATRKKKSA